MFSTLLQSLVLKLPATNSMPDVEDLKSQIRPIYAKLIPLPKDPASIVMEYLELISLASIWATGDDYIYYLIELPDSTRIGIEAYEDSPPTIIINPYRVEIHNIFNRMFLRTFTDLKEHAQIKFNQESPIKEFSMKFTPQAMILCHEPSKEHILDFAKAKEDS